MSTRHRELVVFEPGHDAFDDAHRSSAGRRRAAPSTAAVPVDASRSVSRTSRLTRSRYLANGIGAPVLPAGGSISTSVRKFCDRDGPLELVGRARSRKLRGQHASPLEKDRHHDALSSSASLIL